MSHFLANLFCRLYCSDIHPSLPEFFFLTGTIFFPQSNVELVILTPDKQLLLTWRNDKYGNLGWHLPGGIVRPNETLKERVEEVIKSELPEISKINYTPKLVGISQVFNKRIPSIRSHLLSYVYIIYLSDNPQKTPDHSRLFSELPSNIIKNHHRYKALMEALLNGHDHYANVLEFQ